MGMDPWAGATNPMRGRPPGRLPLRPEPQRAALELGEFRRRSGDDLVAHRLCAAFAVCRKIRYLQQDLRLAFRGRWCAYVVTALGLYRAARGTSPCGDRAAGGARHE